MFLNNLSRGYFVGKDPNAPPFYREEGNKKFQKKDYVGATVLYSKVRQPHLGRRGYVNNLAVHISSEDRTFLLNSVASGCFIICELNLKKKTGRILLLVMCQNHG